MTEKAVWDLERGFWLDGEAHFRKVMAERCVMVFAEPVGIIEGEAIVESLSQMPRWATVEMSQRTFSTIGGGVVVLAYRAEAARDGADTYRALCSSTYAKQDGEWRLVQHQHTPV